MRDTETRPISWRIAISAQVNTAIMKYGSMREDAQAGFLAEAMFSRMLATRDNLGRMSADKYTLKGILFPICNYVTPDDLQAVRDVLSDVGLIIVYTVNGSEYLVFPKAGEYSRLYGNMSESSQCPEPPAEIVKAWEERFNDVYTPCERRSNNVRTPFERRMNTVQTPYERKFREGEGEVEGEVEVEEEGEGERKKTKKPPTKLSTGKVVVKKMTVVQEFVEGFEKTYDHFSGSKYRHSQKDFILATKMIKEFGIDEVVKKTGILAVMCQRGKVWFAKDGFADFTIGNLSAQWNKILPQDRMTPEEVKKQDFLDKLRKERERHEQFTKKA